MGLNLSEKEYKLLLKLIHLGNEKFTEPCLEVFDKDEDLKELEVKVIKAIEEKGFRSRQEELNILLEIKDFKDKFIDNIFWEQLGRRMSERDIIKKHDLYFSDKMNADQVDEFKDIFKEYMDEFYENGLKNIYLKKD